MELKKLTYKDAGVDIDSAEETIRSIASIVQSTNSPGVISGIGQFGGMFEIPIHDYEKPVLVSSMDGVGTKLKVAIMMARFDSIGEDLVNHCINDILTSGAKPLYFLDYLALGKLDAKIVIEMVTGMAKACKQSSCALIGGETAEMPDLYQPGDFDIAGTIVGIVEKSKIIDGSKIEKGDVVIGLVSNGLHTNGYSLARKILFGHAAGKTIHDRYEGIEGTIGEELLRIHKNYFTVVSSILDNHDIHGMAHITGGGIVGNTKRILPRGTTLKINWTSWQRPQIFKLLQKLGNVPEDDMRRTFNLGIGYVLVVANNEIDRVVGAMKKLEEECYQIGRIV